MATHPITRAEHARSVTVPPYFRVMTPKEPRRMNLHRLDEANGGNFARHLGVAEFKNMQNETSKARSLLVRPIIPDAVGGPDAPHYITLIQTLDHYFGPPDDPKSVCLALTPHMAEVLCDPLTTTPSAHAYLVHTRPVYLPDQTGTSAPVSLAVLLRLPRTCNRLLNADGDPSSLPEHVRSHFQSALPILVNAYHALVHLATLVLRASANRDASIQRSVAHPSTIAATRLARQPLPTPRTARTDPTRSDYDYSCSTPPTTHNIQPDSAALQAEAAIDSITNKRDLLNGWYVWVRLQEANAIAVALLNDNKT